MNFAKKGLALVFLCSSLVNVNADTPSAIANSVGWEKAALLACALHICNKQFNNMMTRDASATSTFKKCISRCTEVLTKGAKVVACQMGINAITGNSSTCTKADMFKDVCVNSCMLWAASNMDTKNMPVIGGMMDGIMEDDATKAAMVLACKPVASKMFSSVIGYLPAVPGK